MSPWSDRVTVDCFPECLPRYGAGWAVVAVDVIRATTTAVTAVATGRRCFPVPTLEAALETAARLRNPLLAGECGGARPDGFEENNSPAALAARADIERPLVLLSTAGTRLMHEVGPREAVYAACLRNVAATVQQVAARHSRVAVVGAGTHGMFRLEDRLGCARIAAGLVEAGFLPDPRTRRLVERLGDEPAEVIASSPSADYLRRTDQDVDLHFVLDHLGDLDLVVQLQGRELVALGADRRREDPCGAA